MRYSQPEVKGCCWLIEKYKYLSDIMKLTKLINRDGIPKLISSWIIVSGRMALNAPLISRAKVATD